MSPITIIPRGWSVSRHERDTDQTLLETADAVSSLFLERRPARRAAARAALNNARDNLVRCAVHGTAREYRRARYAFRRARRALDSV